jgi:integrase/recombinase XerD
MIKFELVIQNPKKLNAKGEAAIYLRLSKDRKVKYLATGQYCNPKHWNNNKGEVNAKNPYYKSVNIQIQNFKTARANIYNNTLTNEVKEKLNLAGFMALVKPQKGNTPALGTDFFVLIKSKIKSLKDAGKMGTAKYYNDSLNSISLYETKSKLDLTEINLQWLEGYEEFLKQRNCIASGIAVRMRAIRTIFNKAVMDGTVNLGYYPFKQYKVSKLKGTKKIRSISESELQAIKALDVSHDTYLQLAQNLFMFSYYVGGINFVDMMLLKQSNIINNGNRIEYIRAKTKGEFNLKLTPPAKAIIDQYRANAKTTGHVFPILNIGNVTPTQIANRKHKMLRRFNKDLKTIGLLANIDFDLTSYVARHSFATHLKDKNIPTDVISEALGHQNIMITQTYLKRFGNDVTDNALDKLLE